MRRGFGVRCTFGAVFLVLFGRGLAPAAGAGDVQQLDGSDPVFPFDGSGPSGAECPALPGGAVTLVEALRRALCWSPKTREAWGEVQQSLARLHGARAEYYPSLSAEISGSMMHRTVTDEEFAFDDSNNTLREFTPQGKFTWNVWDFGARHANVESAAQGLRASLAEHDLHLQDTLAEAAQDYFDVIDAEAALRADELGEDIARRVLAAAAAKFKKGTGSVGDMYEARAALAHASMKRIASEGTVRTASGTLAIALGLSPEYLPELSGGGDEVFASVEAKSPAELLQNALAWNPQIVDARASLDGSRYDLEAARASDRPTISVEASAALYHDGYAPGATYGPTDVLGRYVTHGERVGLNGTSPVLDPTYRSKVAAARATVRERAADLEQAKSTVAASVWNDYGGMRTAAETARAANDLILAAEDSLRSEEALYREGVSPIVDVLNAQSALANARYEQLQAVAKWRSSRLALATLVGTLTKATLDTGF